MNRRKFLKSLMVGTAGIATAPLMVRAEWFGVDYGRDPDQSLIVTMEHSHDGIHFTKIDHLAEMNRYVRMLWDGNRIPPKYL